MKIIDEYTPGYPVPKMGQWSCIAILMVNALDVAIKQRELTEEILPFRILVEGQRFFVEMRSVFCPSEHGPKPPPFPKNQTYEIARYCLASMDHDIDELAIYKSLLKMSTFIQRVRTPQSLDTSHIEVAQHLHDLFKKIYQIGSVEACNEMMERSHKDLLS